MTSETLVNSRDNVNEEVQKKIDDQAAEENAAVEERKRESALFKSTTLAHVRTTESNCLAAKETIRTLEHNKDSQAFPTSVMKILNVLTLAVQGLQSQVKLFSERLEKIEAVTQYQPQTHGMCQRMTARVNSLC